MTGHRTSFLIAEACALLAALITFLAVEYPSAVHLMLMMLAATALVIICGLIYIVIAVTEFLGRRGTSTIRFPPGEVIFRQGDPGDFVYKIIDGQVEIVREDPQKEEAVLARLGAGEFFGEAALLSNAPRNATVRTLSAVNAVKIARDDFATLYAHLPDFHERIEAVAQRR